MRLSGSHTDSGYGERQRMLIRLVLVSSCALALSGCVRVPDPTAEATMSPSSSAIPASTLGALPTSSGERAVPCSLAPETALAHLAGTMVALVRGSDGDLDGTITIFAYPSEEATAVIHVAAHFGLLGNRGLWAPDGRVLAVPGWLDGGLASILVVDVISGQLVPAGPTIRTLPRSLGYSPVVSPHWNGWSPSGKWIVLQETGEDGLGHEYVHDTIASVEGDEDIVLENDVRFLAWSPLGNDRYAAVRHTAGAQEPHDTLEIMDVSSREPIQVIDDFGTLVLYPSVWGAWSPDEDLLVVHAYDLAAARSSPILAAPADGTWRALPRPGARVPLYWSPDGRWLVFWAPPSALALMDMAADGFTIVEPPRCGPIEDEVEPLTWTRDGQYFLYREGDRLMAIASDDPQTPMQVWSLNSLQGYESGEWGTAIWAP